MFRKFLAAAAILVALILGSSMTAWADTSTPYPAPPVTQSVEIAIAPAKVPLVADSVPVAEQVPVGSPGGLAYSGAGFNLGAGLAIGGGVIILGGALVVLGGHLVRSNKGTSDRPRIR